MTNIGAIFFIYASKAITYGPTNQRGSQMKTSLFQKTITATVLVLSAMTAQAKTASITVDDYPYIASLGGSATSLEVQLIEQLKAACGNLKNVVKVENIKLNLENAWLTQSLIRPSGTPGADDGTAVLTLAYPHFTGSADVQCKE